MPFVGTVMRNIILACRARLTVMFLVAVISCTMNVSPVQNARVMLALVCLCLYKILAARVAYSPVGSYDGLGV